MNSIPLELISLIGFHGGPKMYVILSRVCKNFNLLDKGDFKIGAVNKFGHIYKFSIYENNGEWIKIPLTLSFNDFLHRLYLNYKSEIWKSATDHYLKLILFKKIKKSRNRIYCKVDDCEYWQLIYNMNEIPDFNENITFLNERKSGYNNCKYEYLEKFEFHNFHGVNMSRVGEFPYYKDADYKKLHKIIEFDCKKITIDDIDFSLFKKLLTIMYFHSDEYAGRYFEIEKY